MECFWVMGQRLDFLAISETTGGHYSFFHVFIPAGPPGPLPHIHGDADEFFFVVEGRVDAARSRVTTVPRTVPQCCRHGSTDGSTGPRAPRPGSR
jgi:mannose-6-phosphate isomerase-like protein (cupin superfamily)